MSIVHSASWVDTNMANIDLIEDDMVEVAMAEVNVVRCVTQQILSP